MKRAGNTSLLHRHNFVMISVHKLQFQMFEYFNYHFLYNVSRLIIVLCARWNKAKLQYGSEYTKT
jgi:hypothetical protein